jgi:hypothetical protein
LLPSSSVAVIDRFKAVIVPLAALGVPPAPPALPTPVTRCPTEIPASVP